MRPNKDAAGPVDMRGEPPCTGIPGNEPPCTETYGRCGHEPPYAETHGRCGNEPPYTETHGNNWKHPDTDQQSPPSIPLFPPHPRVSAQGGSPSPPMRPHRAPVRCGHEPPNTETHGKNQKLPDSDQQSPPSIPLFPPHPRVSAQGGSPSPPMRPTAPQYDAGMNRLTRKRTEKTGNTRIPINSHPHLSRCFPRIRAFPRKAVRHHHACAPTASQCDARMNRLARKRTGKPGNIRIPILDHPIHPAVSPTSACFRARRFAITTHAPPPRPSAMRA